MISIKRTQAVDNASISSYIPSNERVEGKVGDEGTVDKLNDARKHQEDQERIDDFESLRCVVDIGVV